jgi:putative flippase GtrA
MQYLEKYRIARFVTFCVVGTTSSAIDILLLFIGVEFLGLGLSTAATLSFVIASANAYAINRKITFGQERMRIVKYIQFLLVSTIGLLLTLVLLHILTAYLHMHYVWAKIVTVITVVFWNYFGNESWTFRRDK